MGEGGRGPPSPYLLKEGDVEMDIKTLPGTENQEGEGQREESEEPMLDMTDGSVQEDEVMNPNQNPDIDMEEGGR